MSEARVAFDGGPMDGVLLTGLFARVIVEHAPPFTCMEIDGRYEHYVSSEDCVDTAPCFTWAGACRDLSPHPQCGHSHS